MNHLYVLVPVLDEEKHYFVGADEVDKLLAKGETWLASHPERTEIARPCQVAFDPAGNLYVAEVGYRAGMWSGTKPPQEIGNC